MPKTYELDLADYWRIIKRRKMIVLATFCVTTSAIWLHSSRIPPTYEAGATIKIDKPRTAATSDPTTSSFDSSDFIETQMQVLNSHGVAYEAASLSGLFKEGMSAEEKNEIAGQFEGVSATRRGNTNIVDLSVTSGNPEEAALVVNMVAKGYQDWSLKDYNEQARQVREYVGSLLKENESKLNENEEKLRNFKQGSASSAVIGSYQSQLATLELKLSDLLEKYTPRHPEVMETQAQIASLRSRMGQNPQLEMEYNQINREIGTLQTISASLKQKYEEAKISEAQTVSGITILNLASVPDSPIAPDVQKNVTIGAVIALILGILLAFVKENVDTSISTIEEVEDFLQIPILGVIPEMVRPETQQMHWSWSSLLKPFKTFQRSSGSDLFDIEKVRKLVVLHSDEHSFSALEAYKTLRTNVNFAIGQKKGQVLEITSAGAREGKSMTSLNLSLTLAQNGYKTCLVSADLRRETLSHIMGVAKEPGLVEILTKDIPWQDVVRKTTDFLVGELPPVRILKTMGIDNFYLITSGKLPQNPAELLSTDKMKTLLQDLRQNFDYTIIDTPPVLPVSDPSVIASQVDGVILVYQVGRTARGALKRAKVQLASTGANILGVVLNNIKAAEMKMAPTYYYYKEYYGPDEELVREKHKRKHDEQPWWKKLFNRAA
ncbi:MAG: polysaccharide biosynthesis tyrosine autokinase [Deltaproteobacteria bacterium]|nr:polysaccharide biosynthesis tyrosine autokinase [Deltaproteobacteria bacterium]